MLRTFRKSPDELAAVERVTGWVRQRFALAETDVVLVSEVQCALPGCPPVETVIAFWTRAPGWPAGGAQSKEAPGWPAGGAQSKEAPGWPAGGAQSKEAPGWPAGGAQSKEAPGWPAGGAQSKEAPGWPAGGAQSKEAPGWPAGSLQAEPLGRRHHHKIFKPVAAVVEDDLPPAWMKRELAVPEDFECTCC